MILYKKVPQRMNGKLYLDFSMVKLHKIIELCRGGYQLCQGLELLLLNFGSPLGIPHLWCMILAVYHTVAFTVGFLSLYNVLIQPQPSYLSQSWWHFLSKMAPHQNKRPQKFVQKVFHEVSPLVLQVMQFCPPRILTLHVNGQNSILLLVTLQGELPQKVFSKTGFSNPGALLGSTQP